MAVKRYAKRFVATYHYTDPDSGQDEDIAFVANGRIMPLFKSLVGVELSKALEEYKESLCKVINKDRVEAIFKFDEAKTADDKLAVLTDNIDDFAAMMSTAMSVRSYGENDIDLIEAILLCARICALPTEDEGEALAIGREIIPDEIYQDPTFAFEILQLAINYESHAKKKLHKISSDRQIAPELVEEYGLTSCLLYTLAQLGFKIDILSFGMNVIMDVVEFAAAIGDGEKISNEDILDVNNTDVDLEF